MPKGSVYATRWFAKYTVDPDHRSVQGTPEQAVERTNKGNRLDRPGSGLHVQRKSEKASPSKKSFAQKAEAAFSRNVRKHKTDRY
jgi:hypothetical protein